MEELENTKCSSNEKEDDESLYMVHQEELKNAKCYSDEEEDDEILYMVHQAELNNAKYLWFYYSLIS